MTEGVAQAKAYAEKMQIRFTFSTNGQGIYGTDMETGVEGEVVSYPTPDELWNLTFPSTRSAFGGVGAQGLVDLVFERGALEFHLLDFLIGDRLLELLEAADFIVDEVVPGDDRVEHLVGGPEGFDHGAEFGELVNGIVVF